MKIKEMKISEEEDKEKKIRKKIRTPIVRPLSYTTPGHFALPEHSG